MTEALSDRLAAPLRRYKAYPTMKESGIEWLGEIPEHWMLRRLRATVTSCQNGIWGEEPDGIHDVACVRVADFDRLTFSVDMTDPTLRSVAQRFATSRKLERGDLLLEKSGGGENQPVGAVVLFDHEISAVCSNFIARMTVDEEHDPRFLSYLHAALYALRLNTQHIKQSTGIQNLDSASYLNESVPLPGNDEQRTIAAFLDCEAARIDALVAKKERLIELLEEKRLALVSRAVTRGLDSEAQMKESGIDWLGEIPPHWRVAPVYARYDVALGKMLDAKRITGEYSGRYLRNIDVQWGEINTDQLPEMDFHPSERSRYLLRPGDLLVCEGGEVGRTAKWRGDLEECFYQKALHRVRPLSNDEVPAYFFFLMYSLAKRGVFAAGGNPNTIDHLTATQLKHYRFAFPPEQEQRDIVDFLDCETARLDELIAKVGRAIDRLKELRTALISAAVTGKIDVREEVA